MGQNIRGFRGCEGLTTNILPTNEATLQWKVGNWQAPTMKILPTKCLNIAEPRRFFPPKLPAIW